MKKLLIILTLLSFSLQASDPYTKKVTPIEQAKFNEKLILTAIEKESDEQLETVQRLIQAGADINAKSDTGITVLRFATNHGNVRTVKKLLENGANVNLLVAFGTSYQSTPLIEAVLNIDLNMVKLLLRYGAAKTINSEDLHNQTALDYAYDNIQCLQELRDQGKVNKHFVGNDNDNAKIIQLLLHHGAEKAQPYSGSDISDQE